MDLVAALAAPPRHRPKGPPCTVGQVLVALPDDQAAALRTMMDQWPASWVEDALAREGFQIQATTIRRHARRDCKCASRGVV